MAKPVCAPDNAGLVLPAGYRAMLVADGVLQPRHPLVMPNGDIFVAPARVGIIALRDTTGDGHPDVVQRWGGFGGSEVRIRDGYLYGETKTAIIHCPLATERDTRAGIRAFRADRKGQTQRHGVHYASGIRNAVGLAIDPCDGSLWTTQHGRDQLSTNWPKLYDDAKSAETPTEELVQIAKGDDFGWPYRYCDWQIAKRVLAPEYGGDGKSAGRCASLGSNVAAFAGHWAPNALVFSASSSFPAYYREGVFIAFHGSWNRAPLPQAGSTSSGSRPDDFPLALQRVIYCGYIEERDRARRARMTLAIIR